MDFQNPYFQLVGVIASICTILGFLLAIHQSFYSKKNNHTEEFKNKTSENSKLQSNEKHGINKNYTDDSNQKITKNEYNQKLITHAPSVKWSFLISLSIIMLIIVNDVIKNEINSYTAVGFIVILCTMYKTNDIVFYIDNTRDTLLDKIFLASFYGLLIVSVITVIFAEIIRAIFGDV